jgi:formate dehydrogenase beta subunit
MDRVAFSSWNGKIIDNRKGKASKASKSAGVNFPELPGKTDAFMGWNGLVVMNPKADVVSLTLNYLKEARKISCGECSVCMIGIEKILDILELMADGLGNKESLAEVERIASEVSANAKCSYGQAALFPVSDAVTYYKNDFLSLINGGRKPASAAYNAAVTAPCVEACPASLDIPGYIELIKNDRFDESLSLIREKCILPGVVGRVCTHPCEQACVRNYVDEPLSIRLLKRAAADFDLQTVGGSLGTPGAEKKEKVAVIGAGPAGLAAAYNLRLMGYGVTIFETFPQAGGMAAVGIPEYRLPSDILSHEIDLIKRMGVDIKLNSKMDTLDVARLKKEGYDAVFVAVGAHKGNPMGAKGEDAGCEGFVDGVEFLRDVNLGRKIEPKAKVLIIGGGDVAIDCARSCVRLGCKDVEIVYRRSREEMPARDEEIEGAEAEGVKFTYLTAPLEIVASEGKFKCLGCVKMKLGRPDESGRKRPEPVKGTEHTIEADMVICAIGQRPDLPVVKGSKKLSTTSWGTVKINDVTGMTSVDGVFAGGDCVTGPATLIEALDAGNKVAVSIDAYLRGTKKGKEISFAGVEVGKQRSYASFIGKKKAENVDMRDPKKRISDFAEIEGGYTRDKAMQEARRCLRCYRVVVWQ